MSTDRQQTCPARGSPFLSLAGVILGITLVGVLAYQALVRFRDAAGALARIDTPARPRPDAPPAPPSPEELIRRARALAASDLDRADAACRQALADQLQALDRFFVAVQAQVPRFADRALSWESKWLLATDPFRSTALARHPGFLRRGFAEILFAPVELEIRVRGAVEGYLEATRQIEGVLLVDLRRDLAELPTTLPIVTLDEPALRAVLERAAASAAGHVGRDLREDVAREVVALVVGEVLTQAVVRLGASAGLLGAGAASSAATLGSGLIVGLVLDQVLAWLWDGRGELIRELEARIAQVRQLVLEGSAATPGLRPRLIAWDRERSALRRAAVLDLIGRPGGGS